MTFTNFIQFYLALFLYFVTKDRSVLRTKLTGDYQNKYKYMYMCGESKYYNTLPIVEVMLLCTKNVLYKTV